MDATLHRPEDAQALAKLIRRETDAKQRDRYRVAQLAIAGEQCPTIMKMLGRSRGFVQDWAYAYRAGGLDAIAVKPQPGRPPTLPPDQHDALRQRVLDGPTQDDGVAALKGEDIRRILEQEFGVRYTLSGVYELLGRLGLSFLSPRPEHRKSDPAAMAKWVQDAPLLSKKQGKTTPTNKSPSGSRMRHASVSKAR